MINTSQLSARRTEVSVSVAEQHLNRAHDALQGALGDCGAVEAMVILGLLERLASLRQDARNLAAAIQSDATEQ